MATPRTRRPGRSPNWRRCLRPSARIVSAAAGGSDAFGVDSRFRGIEEHYFLQLTNEHLALERFKGRTRRVWKERGANHFLDCRIYNLALADYLGLSRMTSDEWAQLPKLRGTPEALQQPDLLAPDSVKLAAPEAPPAPADKPQQQRRPAQRRFARQSSFMN
jgi:phage terminase large subunit GpA-like protein